MRVERRPVEAVQWTGDNAEEVRQLLGSNMAVCEPSPDGSVPYLAFVQLREDGSAKAVLAQGPRMRSEPTGETTTEEIGARPDGTVITRSEQVMKAVYVPGDWVVLEDGVLSAKGDETMRESFQVEDL